MESENAPAAPEAENGGGGGAPTFPAAPVTSPTLGWPPAEAFGIPTGSEVVHAANVTPSPARRVMTDDPTRPGCLDMGSTSLLF
jgi:hypothetical protein